MSRIKTRYHQITNGVLIIIYFLYFLLLNPYHIIYLEQIQLFRFSGNYFADFLSRPGGLSEFTGSFLTQFFIFPAAGASIITLTGIAVYAVTVYIFRKHHLINGVLFGFLPLLMLAALHSSHLYALAYTIGLLFSLGYVAVIISINSDKLRYSVAFAGWPLLYFFTGGYALLASILFIIHEVFFEKNRARFIIASIFAVLAIIVPLLSSHYIFFLKEKTALTFFLPFFIGKPSKYFLMMLLGWYPLILIIVKVWSVYSKREEFVLGWSLKTIVAATLITTCIAFWIIKYAYDGKTEVLLGIDHSIQQSDWEGALKQASSAPYVNRMIMNFTNLALYKTGHMGDQLFNYPQSGSGGLWLDLGQDWVNAFFGGEVYYHLGYNSEAYRWAFEAMVAKGPNPRSLKRLALTSLADNYTELAEKYLILLKQTLFYRKWANKYLSYVDDPELINRDTEISEKRHFEIHSDFISSDNIGVRLPRLLADHPDNRMAFEYLMASMLLDKNLGGIAENIYRLKELGYKSIPVLYEEAMLAYMSMTNKNIVPEGYNINITTSNRLSEWADMINSFGDNTNAAARAMYGKYGKSYWYYLTFTKIQNQ
jgi:hypothetical protein